jgi:hypothetical protein
VFGEKSNYFDGIPEYIEKPAPPQAYLAISIDS